MDIYFNNQHHHLMQGGSNIKKISAFIIPIIIALFNLLLIMYPSEMIGAAKEGVKLWFNSVMPSLVPFIIGINVLSGFGVIDFIGVLLTPVMRPLFGVPGAGGFALVTSFTSGYPVGAKVTAALRQDSKITQTEAQRLISFCNNSGPLFVLGAVGTGMLNDVRAGYFILTVHYISAILNGLIFKFYKRSKDSDGGKESVSIKTAVKAMADARSKDGRPFGLILGDSVRNAMETVTVIGGFIILFCAFSKALELSGISVFFVKAVTGIIPSASKELLNGLFLGIFEITNGANIISSCEFSMMKYVLLAAIISFGGLSINAQAISFLIKTDIKLAVYFISKLTHALLAAAVGFVLFPYFNIQAADPAETVEAFASYGATFTNSLTISATAFIASVVFMLVVSLLINRKKAD